MHCALVLPALLALVALAAAVPRINVNNPGPLTLNKGFSAVITFTLDEPIICEDPHAFCGVVVLLTNTDTKKVTINTCQVEWTSQNWYVPFQITVAAVEDFVDNGELTVMIQTGAAISNSEYYSGFDPVDITLVTMSRPTATCAAVTDPHYITFDGYGYWTVYQPGQFVHYKSLVREFEVQTRTYISSVWGVATHCGVAAREGNDVFYFNICPGSPSGMTVNFNSPPSMRPVVRQSGNSIFVTFHSGASLEVDNGGFYFNIYVTAPGIDWGQTAGLCGNNNGNPNDDSPLTQYPVSYDLWSWKPTTTVTAPTLPPFASQCPYVAPTVSKPVLSYGDAEDITSILEAIAPAGTQAPLSAFQFNASIIVGATNRPFNMTDAVNQCNAAIANTEVGKVCATLPGINVQSYVDNCVIDLQLSLDNHAFLDTAVTALQTACNAVAGTDVSTWVTLPDGTFGPNPNITNKLCPGACSGHGTCSMQVCTCTPPYMGVDCSHNSALPASVSSLSPNTCDSQDPRGCPAVITVSGSNFISSPNATCVFGGNIKTTLTYLSPTQVTCALPANNNPTTQVTSLSVTVSNDGVFFSQQAIKFSWFDSICSVCDSTATCTQNPTSCVIAGACYSNQIPNPANPCQVCNATASSSAWTFSYLNGFACGPSFPASSYQTLVANVAPVNTQLIQVQASNPYFAGDSAYTVTYSLGLASNTQYFTVGRTTGIVSTIAAIDPSSINLANFNSLANVIATDPAGNTGSTNVFIRLQGTDLPPVFDYNVYNFTVLENATVGTVIGSVHAVDPNAGQNSSVNLGWGVFTYGWILQEANFGGVFAVDNQTGIVTVAKPLNYEAKPGFYLYVRAIDGGGEYNVAQVNVTVIDVFEAASNITISNNQIPENIAVNSVVGTISVLGLDVGDTATLTLLSSSVPFVLSGNNLVVTSSLDYTAPFTYNLVFRSTESLGYSLTVTIPIVVTAVNHPPYNVSLASISPIVQIVGQSITIPENFTVQTAIALATAQDHDPSLTVSCVISSSTNFVMSNNQVVLIAPLNHVTNPIVTFKVACANNGVPSLSTSFVTYTVNVTHSDHSGTNVTLASTLSPVPDNSPIGTIVGTVSAVDPDFDATTLVFSTPSSDHFAFLPGTTVCVPFGTTGAKICSATLAVSAQLNYLINPVEIVHVQTLDAHGLQTVNTISVQIMDTPKPPTGVILTSNTVMEGAANGTVVGTLIVTNQESPSSPYIVSMNDPSGRFALIQSSRRNTETNFELVVANGNRISAIATPTLSLSVRVISGSFDNTFPVTITVVPRVIIPTISTTLVTLDWPVGFKLTTVSLLNLEEPNVAAQFAMSGADTTFLSLTNNADNTATITLIKSLAGFTAGRLSFNITVTFTATASGATVPQPVHGSFSLAVEPVHSAPVFAAFPNPVPVSIDATPGAVLLEAVATASEGTLTYTISNVVPASAASFFTIDPATGFISGTYVPSQNSLPTGTYMLKVTASDGVLNSSVIATFEIRDNCYVADGAAPLCVNGACVNDFKAYTCNCDAGFTGSDCSEVATTVTVPIGVGVVNNPQADTSSKSSGLSAGASVGIAIGVIVGALIAVLLVLVIIRRNKATQAKAAISEVDSVGQAAVFNNGFMKEETYDSPIHPSVDTDFEPGVANPMYAWYQPHMSRQECEEYLETQPEGAFVIRDSSFTPGWHMLAVKTSDSIVHERIKLLPDGTYEMLPSTNAAQPKFRGVPDLVSHYAACKRDGVGFSLALDNPIYDNHLLQEAPRVIMPLTTIFEADAPTVPMRENERAQVAQIANEEQELYTNTAEAKELASGC